SKTRKQQRQAADFRANLEPGQEVMTGSGMFGVIVEVEGDVVTLETSPGVTSRWLRPAIAKLAETVLPVDEDEDADGELEDDEEYEYEDELEAGDLADEEADEADDEADELAVPDDASSLTPDQGENGP